MKLKFWKRSNKSKTVKASKGKRQRKSKDCTECESLRTTVEELQSYRNKVNEQQQQLDELCELVKTTKQEIVEIIAAHQEVTEKSKIEKLRNVILQIKEEHSEEVRVLNKAKEEVADAFQEFKAATEHTMKDEKEELEKLRAEIAEMKEQHQYEREQLKFQLLNQAQRDVKSQHARVLSLKPKPQSALHLAQLHAEQSSPEVIQAPQRIGGLSYNPSTSAFRVYKKDHNVLTSRKAQQESSSSPITAEDEEVGAILSNALPPGEYVRQRYGY